MSIRTVFNQIKIKSSLYSPYYAEACNELRGPFPRLSAWATQLRRNVATVASRWRHCVDLTGPGIEPQTSRTNSVRFATELTNVPLNKNLFPDEGVDETLQLLKRSGRTKMFEDHCSTPRVSSLAMSFHIALVRGRTKYCLLL